MGRSRLAVFDLDGTLLDSDAALVAPFVALGVAAERVTFGMTLEDACAGLGVSVEDYLAAYDADLVQPFPGIADMLAALPRWAVCSNKLGSYARQELERLGWEPAAAAFVEDFPEGKRLDRVLDSLGVRGEDVVFVGDSQHDRDCARAAGATFALAGWNPRASRLPGDVVLHQPLDVLELL